MIPFMTKVVTNTIDFLREVRVELSKVVWPSREQTLKLTLMVILITVVVGFFIGFLDSILAQIASLILK